MAGKYKRISDKLSPLEAISAFYMAIEELAVEAREVFDAIPESLQSGSRGEAFSATADTLENIQTVDAPSDVPEGFPAICEVSLSMCRSKRDHVSRLVRGANACSYASAGVDAITSWIAEQEDDIQEMRAANESNPEDLSEDALALASDALDHQEALVAKWQEFCEEVQENIGEVEGCEFPGMYG